MPEKKILMWQNSDFSKLFSLCIIPGKPFYYAAARGRTKGRGVGKRSSPKKNSTLGPCFREQLSMTSGRHSMALL